MSSDAIARIPQDRKPADPGRLLRTRMEASANMLDSLREVAAGDDEFFSDLIEGQTDIFDIIARVDESELEDRMLVTGITEAIEKLKVRKAAAEKRAETKRTMIAVALQQIGIRTHRTPLGTITVSPKTPTALVVEEADIPSRFWKPQAPQLDKTALNSAVSARRLAFEAAEKIEDADARRRALEAADAEHPLIPGVTLSNGGVKISIRR